MRQSEGPEGLVVGGEELAGGGEGEGVGGVDAEVGVGFVSGEGVVAVADGVLEPVEVGGFEGEVPEGVVGGGELHAGQCAGAR